MLIILFEIINDIQYWYDLCCPWKSGKKRSYCEPHGFEESVNIARTFDISPRTIYQWIHLYLDTKLIYNNNFQLNKKRFNSKKYRYYENIINYVNTNKGCSIYDIYLNAVDKQISLSTISRICKNAYSSNMF